jgi:hypothetical protein
MRAAGPPISSPVRPLGHRAHSAPREGSSQVQSIKATVERLDVSLTEAKKIVHLAAWADVRSENDSFHEAKSGPVVGGAIGCGVGLRAAAAGDALEP